MCKQPALSLFSILQFKNITENPPFFLGQKETYFLSLPTVSPELLELREESQ